MKTIDSIDQTEARRCALAEDKIRTKELTAEENRFYTEYRQLMRHFWQCGVNSREAGEPFDSSPLGNAHALSIVGERCLLAWRAGHRGDKRPPEFPTTEDMRVFVRTELIPASRAAAASAARF